MSAAAPFSGFLSFAQSRQWPDLDAFIVDKMKRDHIPGLVAAIVDRERILWSKSFGWADIERRIPISMDTVQNICSISKTFTTTALMRLWELKKFQLDDDVSDHLPFRVRHPAHPDKAITFRLLMTHTSAIRDGISYGKTYGCGDPRMALRDWIEAYLTPGGQYFDAQENFHPWAPGERWDYCNVAYGLLGYLVESISGVDFARVCRRDIFEPLQMKETSWYLRDIDPSHHVVPYTYVSNGVARGPRWGGEPLGVIRERKSGATKPISNGYEANCLYNHPNYPDGFLRTSLSQIIRYLQTWLRTGRYGNYRLLGSTTVEEMLRPHFTDKDHIQGLTWQGSRLPDGNLLWGHGGSDPGINTDIRFNPSAGVGAVVFTNTNGIEPRQVTTRLLEEIAGKG